MMLYQNLVLVHISVQRRAIQRAKCSAEWADIFSKLKHILRLKYCQWGMQKLLENMSL
jgi:hypothetical protein